MSEPTTAPQPAKRPKIVFFEYADVFEDFYPHYGITQRQFATEWDNSGNHAFVTLLQREIGDVIWCCFSVSPEIKEAVHGPSGCRVIMLRSSWLHRQLWRAFYLPRFAWRWRGCYPLFAFLSSYLAPLSFELAGYLRRERPDFAFVQDYSSGKFDILAVVAKLCRMPLVAYHSGSEAAKHIGKAIRRWTLPGAHRVLASSKAEAESITSRYHVPGEHIRVLLTPIDITQYHPEQRSASNREPGPNLPSRYLLFVGRLDDGIKRVSAIIRAFGRVAEKHPSTELLIVGDGADRQRLHKIAQEVSPARIKFLGWISETKVKASLYATAEYLVLASLREGFPTVIGEAMACGTPVISSNVGAVPEMVIDGVTGWLFPPGDDEALVQALENALSQSREEMDAMREQARAIAERKVSPEAITTTLRECFAS